MAKGKRKPAGIRKRAGNPNWQKERSGNPATQWRPGQSGNREGYSEEYRTARELAREHTATAVARLAAIMSTSESDAASVRAAEILIDRADGKAVQEIHVAGPGGGPVRVDLSRLTDEELEAAERLGAKLLASAAEPPGDSGGEGPEEAG